MKNYSKYEAADFLLDDSFVRWVQDGEDSSYWASVIKKYPEKEEVIFQARELVASVRVKTYRDISDNDVSKLAQLIAEKTYLLDQDEVVESGVRPLYKQTWLKIAATILLASALGVLAYKSYFKPAVVPTQISSVNILNDKSEPMLVRLPDNSSVVLKPGSRLMYSNSFNKQRREVSLDGEAFFEVAKDKTRPFIVYSNELVTKVLGTSFLVKAIKGSNKFSVIVNTGKVSVFDKSQLNASIIDARSLTDLKGKGVLISPNQEADFYRSDARLVKKNLAEPAILSEVVTKTSLNFVDTPFSEVVKVLSNAYDIHINYDKNTMSDCPLTASLTHQSLYEKLRLICNAVEADYQIVEGEVEIRGKGCKLINNQ